jgi:predicted dehydrogenase
MNKVKWGIIGCGNVTEVKSGPAFNKIPNSELVAVMRRDAGLAADYAQRHNVPAWYDKADDLINDPEVNAIYVATPPDTHELYAVKAMRAGKPVYVEKPMGRNTAECQRMINVSQETGMPLFVAYYRRAMPYFQKVKELVDSGIVGDIRFVHISLQWQPREEETGKLVKSGWRVDPEVSGGGHFHDLAAHQFDFLEYVFGPVKTAQGITRNQADLYMADDITVANWEFESGVLGTGSWCFTVSKEQRQDEAKVIGSKGQILFSFFEKADITVLTERGSNVYTIPYPEHVQEPLIAQIVGELTGDINAVSTGTTAIRSNIIMDMISGKLAQNNR